jgi:fucose permease
MTHGQFGGITHSMDGAETSRSNEVREDSPVLARPAAPGGWLLITVAFIAFISLGLPDAVLGIAWPTMRVELGKAISYLGVVLLAGSSGYILSSFCAAWATHRLGIGTVLLLSTGLVATGLVGYTLTPWFWGVCASAVLVGLGSGAIDSCLNAFVSARLKPAYMSWLHGFYGVGATIGPAIMTWAVTSSVWGWRAGYAALAATMGVLTVVFLLTQKPWRQATMPREEAKSAEPIGLRQTLRLPAVWMQVTLFFIYCAIEVTAAQWLYSLLSESRGRAETLSGMSVTAYWGLFTVGRFVLGAMTLHIAQARILRWSMWLAPLPCLTLWLGLGGTIDLISAALIGFFLAPIYPMLMSETVSRVGEAATAQSIGLQVSAAVLGVSFGPMIGGLLARGLGLEAVPVYLLGLCVLLLVLHEVVLWRGKKVTGHATNRGGGEGA